MAREYAVLMAWASERYNGHGLVEDERYETAADAALAGNRRAQATGGQYAVVWRDSPREVWHDHLGRTPVEIVRERWGT